MCTRKGRSKGGINAKFHPSCLRADVMHKALLEHFINMIVFLLPGSASVMYKVHRLTEKLTKHEAEAKQKKAVS